MKPGWPKAALLSIAVVALAELATRELVRQGLLRTAPRLTEHVEAQATAIARRPGSIWLMGNSTLAWGLDPGRLREAGHPVISLTHGSATLRGSVAMGEYYVKATGSRPESLFFFITLDDLNRNGYRARQSRRYLEYGDFRFDVTDYIELARVKSDLRDLALSALRASRPGGSNESEPALPVEQETGEAQVFDGAAIAIADPWFRSQVDDFELDEEAFQLIGEMGRRLGIPAPTVVMMPVTDRYVAFHEAALPGFDYRDLRERLRKLAAEAGVDFVDAFGPSDRYRLFRDPYHLNREGKREFTERFLRWLGETR